MTNSIQSKKDEKILIKIASGITLSVMFMLLGYLINNSMEREVIPSFENAISKNIIILFFGLLSGYNIGSSLKKDSSTYYFYAGIVTPIFILILYSLIMNNEYYSTLLIVLGLLFPILFIYSGLMESRKRFKKLLDIFGKYIPTITVVTVAIGDYGFSIINLYVDFGFNLILVGYAVGICIALVILFVPPWLESIFEDYSL